MKTVLQETMSDLDATKELYISFNIKGEFLIPNEVSEDLNMTPLHSFAKGDVIKHPPNIITETKHRLWGMWQISTQGMVNSIKIEDHLIHLIARLEPAEEKLQKYLSQSDQYSVGFRIWRVAVGTAGIIDIPSILLNRLCAMSHSITLHYVCEDEEY